MKTTCPSRRFLLPRNRRLTTDVLHYSRKIPLCPHDRYFEVGPLHMLRQGLEERVSWSLLFMKAFALVAKEEPVLRRLYFPWPIANVYEHSCSVAMMAIQRTFRGEPWLFWGRFVQPEGASLRELQSVLTRYQNEPPERAFRQQLQLSSLPTPLRRAIWWWNLNVSGTRRARRTGTCFLSTLAGEGVEIQAPPACLTSNLTYGPIDRDGRMRVTMNYDHRLMDGHLVARAMQRWESVLTTDIARELASLNTQLGVSAA